MDAAAMASPFGMAAAPAGKAWGWMLPKLERVTPKAWSPMLFAPEETALQQRIIAAAEAAKQNPEFMQNLFMGRSRALQGQMQHPVYMGQEITQKSDAALEAAKNLLRLLSGGK